MVERNRRINVTLEPDYAQRLASLAERTHIQEGTLARSFPARLTKPTPMLRDH
jgi:hypothetical protein